MSERRYTQIRKAVYERPWAIQPAMLAVIEEIVRLRATGSPLTEQAVEQRIAAADNGPRRGGLRAQGVSIIPIYGVITQRANLMSEMSGATSVEQITSEFRGARADPDVGAIVFDIDSPGGAVDGIAELADEIRGARGTKPMVAVANTSMASAAYWLGSAADEVIVMPSGLLGSIGVIGMHVDVSAQDEMLGEKVTLITAGTGKEDGNEHLPLSDRARADMQSMADDYYALFVEAVAKGRGVKAAQVTRSWKAQVYTAKKAVQAGLADRVDTLDATVQRLVAAVNRPFSMAAMAAELNQADLSALVSGRPYAERLSLASAVTADLAESTDQRIALRASEGRGLSEESRTQLLALSEHLRAMAATTQGSGGEPEPGPDVDPETIADPPSSRRIGLAVFEAATAGGYRFREEVSTNG